MTIQQSFDNRTTREYTDLDLSLLPHPISKDVRQKTGVEAIKASIRNLVFLNHYEKPFHPEISGDIYSTLFENIGVPETKIILQNRIIKLIERYEKRARILDVFTDVMPDDNLINITIAFVPINSIEPATVEIHLDILR